VQVRTRLFTLIKKHGSAEKAMEAFGVTPPADLAKTLRLDKRTSAYKAAVKEHGVAVGAKIAVSKPEEEEEDCNPPPSGDAAS